MRRFTMLATLLLGLAAAGGAQAPVSTASTATPSLSASATLRDPAGQVQGSATFRPAGQGVMVTVEVRGLTPGQHGMHFHETAVAPQASTLPPGRSLLLAARAGILTPA